MRNSFGKLALGSMALGLALGSWSMGPAPAAAASGTANLTVTATVVDECSLSAGTLAFGNYSSSSDASSSALLDVTCQGASSAWSIAFDGGANPIGCQRRISDGGNTLMNYSLFRDASFTMTQQIDGSNCDDDIEITGKGSSEDPTIYGLITSGSTAPSGSYSDTVVMTISF